MLPWIPVFLAVGWGLMHAWGRRVDWPGGLSIWALRVALPATVLRVLAGVPATALRDPAVLLPWLILPPSLGLVWLLSRLRRWPAERTRLVMLLIPLGNTSFLGLPLLAAVRGPEALHPALLFDQFGSFPQLLLLGTLLLESRDPAGGWRRAAWRCLSFPPLWALALAMSPLGPAVARALSPLLAPLSWTLVPSVMLALGARLSFRLPREQRATLAWGLAGKMLLVPALAGLALWLLDWRGAHAQVALLEAAMPPMATAAAWAAERRCEPEAAAALVSVGILVALGWIPLLDKLIQGMI